MSHTANRPVLATSGYASFLAIGGVAGVYGPMRTLLETHFKVGLADTKLMIQVHFIGALIGLLALPRVGQLMSARTLMVVSCAVFAAAALLLGFAGSWNLVLMAAFGLGLSFGFIDLGENALFAYVFADRRGLMLNLLNGMFAIGSVLAPLLLAQVGAYPTVMVALSVLALVAMFGHAVAGAAVFPQPEAAIAAPTRRDRALVPAFVFLYLAYVMMEVGIGAGFAKLLEAYSHTPAQAALWTAGFWGGLVISRFGFAVVADRFVPSRVLLTISVLALVSVGVALSPSMRGLGIVLAGFALGPFFPVGLDWLGNVRPNDSRAMGFAIIGGCVGGITGPLIVEQVAGQDPAKFLNGFLVLAALLVVAIVLARSLVPDRAEIAR